MNQNPFSDFAQDKDTEIPDISGLVEVCGRQEAAEVWIVSGWLLKAPALQKTVELRIVLECGTIRGEHASCFMTLATCPKGVGFLLALTHSQRRLGSILFIEIGLSESVERIRPASDFRELQGRELLEHADAVARACPECPNIADIRELVARRFVGEEYVDACGYHVPPVGWFFSGWNRD